jgi:hypothetical protein
LSLATTFMVVFFFGEYVGSEWMPMWIGHWDLQHISHLDNWSGRRRLRQVAACPHGRKLLLCILDTGRNIFDRKSRTGRKRTSLWNGYVMPWCYWFDYNPSPPPNDGGRTRYNSRRPTSGASQQQTAVIDRVRGD